MHATSTKSSVPPPGPRFAAPHLFRIPLPPRLGHRPRDARGEDGGERRKDEEDPALAEGLVEHGEELRDDEGGGPVCGEGPALRGADGLWADELAAEDKGHGPEAEGEAGDEAGHGARGEAGQVQHDRERERERRGAHGERGQQEAGAPAEAVRKRGAQERDGEVEQGEEDVEQGGGGAEEGREQRDAVHDAVGGRRLQVSLEKCAG